jgi:type II secretory pathway pseudopilin PulG
MEAVTVISMLGIIALLAIPRFSGNSAAARKNACYTLRGNTHVQIQLWYREKAAWPATNLSDIAADPAYFPEGLSRCPVDGTSYVMDPTTHYVVGHTH